MVEIDIVYKLNLDGYEILINDITEETINFILCKMQKETEKTDDEMQIIANELIELIKSMIKGQ